MRIRLVFFVAATVAVLSQATPSFATQVFFSNLVEPGDQYGPDGLGIGHTPAYPAGDTWEALGATGFTPSATFRLTSIDIALGYPAGFSGNGPNQADVYLMNDSGGLPGSTIESWDLTNLPTTCGPCPLSTITSPSNPVLVAGNQYWVVASGGQQTFDFWTFTLGGNSFDPLATRAILNGVDSGWVLDTSNHRQGALVVSGDAVPEPTSLALTILVLPALLLWRCARPPARHRSSGTR
jgi:hypothetical protein